MNTYKSINHEVKTLGNLYDFFSRTNNKYNIGVTKEEIDQSKDMGAGYFFKLFRRSFSKLTALNLVFLLCNFPIFFLLYGISGNLNTTVNTPTSPLFAQLYGIMQYEQNPLTAALNGVIGNSTELSVVSVASRILIYFGYALIITVGLSSVGMFYVLRNMVRSEYVSVWHDFFATIKKNLKQGIIIGILDSLIILLLGYDILIYGANTDNFLMSVFYFAVIIFSFIYFIMRYYIYTILVTFDLPIKKIYKNAFLLAVLGIKRNIIAILATVVVALISIYIFILLPTVGLLLVFIFSLSVVGFIGAYCTYPNIKRYMIDPYYEEHPEELPEESDEEPIFKDRG
ncbi:MAG: hypothetical protein CVU97_07330 [Firmicutes bacterium HGW-Firmicutes-21]|nr:MAG: hypothetical protein CVU97_07330 [Firmicutes bacterium HGW-Firmicutes-21]